MFMLMQLKANAAFLSIKDVQQFKVWISSATTKLQGAPAITCLHFVRLLLCFIISLLFLFNCAVQSSSSSICWKQKTIRFSSWCAAADELRLTRKPGSGYHGKPVSERHLSHHLHADWIPITAESSRSSQSQHLRGFSSLRWKRHRQCFTEYLTINF